MIDYLSLALPVSDALPCGPDLETDEDFLNFMTGAEGRLPASFFSFSRESFNVKDELQAIAALLERTRDIRLLVLAGKFSILAGDLVGFVDAVEAISVLLGERWDDVHPQVGGGKSSLRRVQIESLDDMPTVCLPLQYAPLVKHRRHGTISLRSHLVAVGEAQLRDGETALDSAAIRDGLLTSDDLDGLKSIYQASCRLEKALSSISERYLEATDYAESLSFERLPILAQKIRMLIEEPLAERDPSAVLTSGVAAADHSGAQETAQPLNGGEAAPESSAAALPPQGELRRLPQLQSLDAAANALQAAERYFAGFEPSNPCLLLIRQAQQLIGKSFLEAMHLLVPGRLESAIIKLGGQHAITIPVSQISPFASSGEGRASGGGSPSGEQQTYSATTRTEAVNLIEATEQYFCHFEPSSPVPLLLARARSYMNRDFSSLLDEFAPPAKP